MLSIQIANVETLTIPVCYSFLLTAHNNSSGFDVKFSSMERIEIHSDRFVIITTNPINVPYFFQELNDPISRTLSVFTDSTNLGRLEETLKHRKIPVIKIKKEKEATPEANQASSQKSEFKQEFGERLELAKQGDQDDNVDQESKPLTRADASTQTMSTSAEVSTQTSLEVEEDFMEYQIL